MAAGNARDRPCPSCGTSQSSRATRCSGCGAALPATGVDALVSELEALETEAIDGALAEELDELKEVAAEEAVEETLAELEAVEEAVPEAPRPRAFEAADLSAFVRKVEDRVVARARPALEPLPRPSRFSGPALGAAGLVLAVGLFLLPASWIVGSSVIFVAGALAGVGVVLRTSAA